MGPHLCFQKDKGCETALPVPAVSRVPLTPKSRVSPALHAAYV